MEERTFDILIGIFLLMLLLVTVAFYIKMQFDLCKRNQEFAKPILKSLDEVECWDDVDDLHMAYFDRMFGMSRENKKAIEKKLAQKYKEYPL